MNLDEMKNLPQIIRARAQETPNRVSERHKRFGIWHEFSWREVHEHVRDFALGLHDLGLQRGGVVLVIGENEPEHFWAEYAAQSLGAAVVSVFPDQTAAEIAYLLEDSGARIIVAQDQEQVDKALEISRGSSQVVAIIYWDDAGLWSYHDPLLHSYEEIERRGRAVHAQNPGLYDQELDRTTITDVAVLSYTSGTTGKPKGVIITHRYLFDNAMRVLSAFDIPSECEYLTYIAPAWITEQIFGLTLGLIVPMVINFPESPEEVLSNLRELAVEAVVFSPRQWESLASSVQARMLDAGPIRRAIYRWGLEIGRRVNLSRLEGGAKASWMDRLLYPAAELLVLKPIRDKLGLVRTKIAVCGGSSMAPEVYKFFHAIGVPLRNAYGATETGLLTAHQGERFNLETMGQWLRTDPRYGDPLEWKVTEKGELLVRGGSGFLGYHGDPEKSAAYMLNGWCYIGDAVSLTDEGELVFLDRVKDLRRLSNGHVFPPQFIEIRLRFSPFIKDVLVLGDERKDYVAALINIDFETVTRWAEERNIGFTTYMDLSQRPEIRNLVRSEIEHINTLLPEHARIRRFAIFPKELDPDEGELTRTRKLRRSFLEQRYSELINAIYEGRDEVRFNIEVTYQDGQKGKIEAYTAIVDVT